MRLDGKSACDRSGVLSHRGMYMDQATHQLLLLSKPDSNGVPVRIGTLHFDETNHATLTLDRGGPEAAELERVWAEICRLGELTWKQSRPEVIDGEEVMSIVGVDAKPGDVTYIYAVLNTLERRYGYSVNLQRR
jgi:hypothetical protein